MIDNTKKRRPRIRKLEEARMVVLNTLGHTPNSIANIIGRNVQTVRIHLGRAITLSDPETKELVEQILAVESKDLAILGDKARTRLHELLDRGEVKPIEAVACMDRSFQQRRLLDGLSTQNIGIVEAFIILNNDIKKLQAELDKLEAEETEPEN